MHLYRNGCNAVTVVITVKNQLNLLTINDLV